jgi:hypothetical protein
MLGLLLCKVGDCAVKYSPRLLFAEENHLAKTLRKKVKREREGVGFSISTYFFDCAHSKRGLTPTKRELSVQ